MLGDPRSGSSSTIPNRVAVPLTKHVEKTRCYKCSQLPRSGTGRAAQGLAHSCVSAGTHTHNWGSRLR